MTIRGEASEGRKIARKDKAALPPLNNELRAVHMAAIIQMIA
jgi:hypothetical protein